MDRAPGAVWKVAREVKLELSVAITAVLEAERFEGVVAAA
jgi:hypothetical protein